MRRVLLLPTLLLLGLALGGYLLSGGIPRGPRTLVFCNADDIKTLDPGKMSWANDIRVAMGLWEGLAAYEPRTLEPIPGVAQRWEISPDGRTYTFHLRPNACWSTGEPVLARDFVFAWKRVLTPSTGAEYINLFFPIRGAKAYYEALDAGKPADFASVGVRTPDERTISVELAAPCGYFLDLLAFPPYYPLHEASMQPFAERGGAGFDPYWMRPQEVRRAGKPVRVPVTNGPFVFAEWRFKQYLKLTPNPHYWDRAAVQTEALLITAIADPRTALLAYEQGQVDALSFVPQTFGELLLEQRDRGRRHDVQYRPVFGTYYYIFNTRQKPFDDKRVRKALTLAIDKQQIVTHVTRMGQRPVNVLVPPESIRGYRGPAGLAMNVTEARRLLAEAGFPGGAGFPVTEILFNTEDPTHGKVAQAIGQMWREALGVNVNFRGVERGSFGSGRRQHNFTIARGGWYGDYTDPTTWLDLCRTGDGNNDGQFSSNAFDELLTQAAAEADPGKRFALLAQAERLLVEDELPLLPLYQYADGYIFDPQKIAGLEANVRLLTQFKYVYKK